MFIFSSGLNTEVLTGDEGSYRPTGLVRLFGLKEEKFSADKQHVLNWL